MPIFPPGSPPIFLINDLVNEVLLKAENRTNDTTRAAIWIRDALLEISSNPDYRDDFQGLENWGPEVYLTTNQQEYLESSFIVAPNANLATLDVLLWIDYPTNTIRRKLDVSHYQKTDKFQPTYALPTEWYTFNNLIGFNPVPDKPYSVQVRYLIQHPINDGNLPQTNILLPREWNEVLVWAAVQRAFMEFMEYEKAASIHTLLYGDPLNKNQPGLIFHVKRKRRREQYRMEQRLYVVRRPYMWGHP
jgi:hypothetical protein